MQRSSGEVRQQVTRSADRASAAPSLHFRRCRRASRAFTLIELILVMLILFVLASMVVPAMSGFGHGRRIEDAATEVLALIQFARERAISDGTVYRMNFDSQARAYQLTRLEGDAFVQLGEEAGRRFILPEGVDANWELPQREDGAYIEFLPTGRSEAATVTLSDDKGKTITITAQSPTELFRILPQQPAP
jgi:type II secretion system protein H